MANELRPGMTRPGILVDGLEGTPYLACNLTYETGRVPLVEVPYAPGEPQFRVTQSWFMQEEDLPRGMTFHDPEGVVTLTGVRWRGNRGSDVAIGKLDARVAIFGRARHLADEYRPATVRSRIDGLREFAGFESIHTGHDQVDGQTRTIITLSAKGEIRVEHGGIKKLRYLNHDANGHCFLSENVWTGPGSTDCMGECGPSCAGLNFYTQDCGDHDRCGRVHGGSTNPWDAECGDEYWDADDDFMLGWPQC